MRLTNRNIVGIILVVATGACSLVAWRVFFLGLAVPGVTDMWQSALWFFLLLILFFLGSVVWSTVLLRCMGSAAVFLPGLVLLHDLEYMAALFLSVGLAFWSSTGITREVEERVSFHFFKSVRAGQFLFIAGLALALSSGYHVSLKEVVWEELVPRFQVGEEITDTAFKVVGFFNPSFASLAESDATVDEFLLNLEEQQTDGMPLVVFNTRQKQAAQELFLQSGREQLATLAGRHVAGDEKMSHVLSSTLQRKLIALLKGEDTARHVPPQAIPFFLALLLFVTLLSLLSIVGIIAVFVALLLFYCLLIIRWLKLEMHTVEQERLAE